MEVPRLRFTRAIPSWAVGALGASIVVFSVTVGSVWVDDMETNVNRLQAMLSEFNTVVEDRWRQHTIADNRAETAHLMFALAAAFPRGNQPDPFLLDRAGVSLRGAITTMWFSTPGTENENIEALSSTVDDLRAKLNGGDLAAYTEMTKILFDQDARSTHAIREFRERIAKGEAQMNGFRLDVATSKSGSTSSGWWSCFSRTFQFGVEGAARARILHHKYPYRESIMMEDSLAVVALRA